LQKTNRNKKRVLNNQTQAINSAL